MSLVLLYATGCHRRDAVIDRAVAISRVPTALTIAGITLFVGLHYDFPHLFRSQRVFWGYGIWGMALMKFWP